MDFDSEIMEFIEEKCMECQDRHLCEELCQKMEYLYDVLEKELNKAYDAMLEDVFDSYR